jgi:hypothetical protein
LIHLDTFHMNLKRTIWRPLLGARPYPSISSSIRAIAACLSPHDSV